jgi:hypothetical protein
MGATGLPEPGIPGARPAFQHPGRNDGAGTEKITIGVLKTLLLRNEGLPVIYAAGKRV